MLDDGDKQDMLKDAKDLERGKAFSQIKASMKPMDNVSFIRFCTEMSRNAVRPSKKSYSPEKFLL